MQGEGARRRMQGRGCGWSRQGRLGRQVWDSCALLFTLVCISSVPWVGLCIRYVLIHVSELLYQIRGQACPGLVTIIFLLRRNAT